MAAPACSHADAQAVVLKVLRDLLGARQYRVAWLRFGLDMEPAAIARRLRVSRSTVWRDLLAVARFRETVDARLDRERLLRSQNFDERMAGYYAGQN